jgi:hypothetical protein
LSPGYLSQSDTNNFTLSSQVGNFDLVETACNQAGYDLMPYVGQHITEIGYSLAETISGASIYLIVFATDQTTICGFIRGGDSPGFKAVNDPNIK